MNTNEQIKEYLTIYEQLRKKYRWRVNSTSLMMLAGQLATAEKPFELKHLISLNEKIKKESSQFSYIQSADLRLMLTGLLVSNFDDPKKSFDDMMLVYEKLIDSGFSRSPHAYIAAYALYVSLDSVSDEEINEHVARAKSMYSGMKKQHFFLTSHEDYPLSVLLAEEEGEEEELLDDMAYYYDQLHIVLAKGNNRQFLSQILTYGRQDNRQLLVQNTVTWLDDLKTNKIRLRGNHLPIVGVLALAGTPSALLNEVKETYDELVSIKGFKWHKDLCFMTAVRFVLQKKVQENNVLDVGLASTIESILQAQQAAVLAAMSAGAAASASSSNN
ncbi:hypothetical protein JMA_07110 [Jeotgalibacillus malaysiensis]|uniref:DUF4003 domain-containing protein n=1 Tax=Jeotgalibacillus malaysiensis TaxID=1508404 RepID=A0A0B5ANB7_9BACL|nr:DUF4003 family protein [Jeotgalibacillus malaysiensis]AJD90028.1 hypothetical protein JMA_07110 [Jeotgalibacillus malaysiensis]